MPDVQVIEYPVGQPIGASITVRGADGLPTNADEVTLVVTYPTGTVTTYTLSDAEIEHPALGQYRYLIETATAGAGPYYLHWSFTDPNGAADDLFFVGDGASTLVTTRYAEERLQVQFTPDQGVAAARVIQEVLGEVEAHLARSLTVRSYTDTFPAPAPTWVEALDRDGFVRLRHNPVRTLTSVTIDGVVVNPAHVSVDPSRRGVQGTVGYYGQTLVVVYTAGLDAANEPGLLAVLRKVACRAVQQHVLDGMPAVNRVSVEGTSYDYTGWLTPDDRRALSLWKRR
jgi:hypothetical protein